MAKTAAQNKPGHVTHGNVLEDLGFSADEIRETEIKMSIWRPLRVEIETRGLTQLQLAELLTIHQPEASLLVRGKLLKFSVLKLMQFAERLGLAVRVTVRPPSEKRHARSVRTKVADAKKRTRPPVNASSRRAASVA